MEKLLPRCLKSLENQTIDGIQYILVDDGSTDSSGIICDSWKPQNHSVKVVHKQNEGVTAGWMQGVLVADGEYVGFVDSDDYIENDMYEVLWNAVEKDKVDISMCNHCREIDGVEGKKSTARVIEDGVYKDEELNHIRYQVLPKIGEHYLSPSLCNKIFRKDLFLGNFKYASKEVTIADDVSIVIPCIFACKSFSYIHKDLYHAVSRKGSVTNTYKENMYHQYQILLDNIKNAIDYYNPIIPKDSYSKVVSFMGNQWLRMIAKCNLSKEKKQFLLETFYNDKRYIEAAEEIENISINKWFDLYAKTILYHKYCEFDMFLKLLDIKNKLLNK